MKAIYASVSLPPFSLSAGSFGGAYLFAYAVIPWSISSENTALSYENQSPLSTFLFSSASASTLASKEVHIYQFRSASTTCGWESVAVRPKALCPCCSFIWAPSTVVVANDDSIIACAYAKNGLMFAFLALAIAFWLVPFSGLSGAWVSMYFSIASAIFAASRLG